MQSKNSELQGKINDIMLQMSKGEGDLTTDQKLSVLMISQLGLINDSIQELTKSLAHIEMAIDRI